VSGGKCPPITRRIIVTRYLFSVHGVEGQAREPMTEEEMRQFMERIGVLEHERAAALAPTDAERDFLRLGGRASRRADR
jgi:hypothetical protein